MMESMWGGRRRMFWRKEVIVFVFVFVFLCRVSALEIQPAKTSFEFDQDIEKKVTLDIVNNEHKKMNVVLLIQGALNESITLYESHLAFLPSEQSKRVEYSVRLSGDLQPGLYTGEILALEIPQTEDGELYTGTFDIGSGQIHGLEAYRVGKEVDINAYMTNPEQNTQALFRIELTNKGNDAIQNAFAVIDIYTVLNEKVGSVTTETLSLPKGGKIMLKAPWNVDVNLGNYIAEIHVHFDNESKTLEKGLAVGVNMLHIDRIWVNEFSLGEIAKLQILVENLWSDGLKDIFANLLVYNSGGNVMVDVKSSSEELASLSKRELVAYWDTAGVEEGSYQGKVIVKYGEKTVEQNLVLNVQGNSLEIQGVGFAVRGARGGGVSLVSVLLMLVILLLLVNLSWFIFFRRPSMKSN